KRLADASNVDQRGWTDALREWPSQAGLSRGVPEDRIRADIRRSISARTFTGWVHAFRLAVLTMPDAAVAPDVRAAFSVILRQFPNASRWTVRTSQLMQNRIVALRGLFAARQAPELLRRSTAEFEGFRAGHGLHSDSMMELGGYISSGLMAWAPNVL